MSDDYTKEGNCSLCGGPYTEWGRNPEPLRPFEERCCARCDEHFVVPLRIARVLNHKPLRAHDPNATAA